MYKQILTFVVAACVAPCFAADGWILDDMEAARRQAAEQNKGIIIDFTGSDWCMPCRNLKATVLSQADFIQKASADFVLVELDFPRGRKQSPEVKEANNKLSESYGVSGFPTVVFTDAQGNPLESFVGGRPMDAALATLAAAQGKLNLSRAAAQKFGEATTDAQRIEALMEQLKLAPKDYLYSPFYDKLRAQIAELDKEDSMGFRAAAKTRAEVKAQTEAVIAWLKENIKRDMDNDKLIALVRSYPDKEKLLPEARQNLMMFEMNFHYDAKTAQALAKEIIALGADTPAGIKAAEVHDNIQRQLDDYARRQKKK